MFKNELNVIILKRQYTKEDVEPLCVDEAAVFAKTLPWLISSAMSRRELAWVYFNCHRVTTRAWLREWLQYLAEKSVLKCTHDVTSHLPRC